MEKKAQAAAASAAATKAQTEIEEAARRNRACQAPCEMASSRAESVLDTVTATGKTRWVTLGTIRGRAKQSHRAAPLTPKASGGEQQDDELTKLLTLVDEQLSSIWTMLGRRSTLMRRMKRMTRKIGGPETSGGSQCEAGCGGYQRVGGSGRDETEGKSDGDGKSAEDYVDEAGNDPEQAGSGEATEDDSEEQVGETATQQQDGTTQLQREASEEDEEDEPGDDAAQQRPAAAAAAASRQQRPGQPDGPADSSSSRVTRGNCSKRSISSIPCNSL